MAFEITDVRAEDDRRFGGDRSPGDASRTHRDALDVADGVIAVAEA